MPFAALSSAARLTLIALLLACCSPAVFATDVTLSGGWSYTHNGTTAVMAVDKVINHASGGHSGSLRLELWAMATPYTGAAQSGYQLATYQLATLNGGFQYSNVASGTVTATRPGKGTWFISLILTEYDGTKWVARDFMLPTTGKSLTCSTTSCSGVVAASTAATATLSSNRTTFTVNNGETLTLSGNIMAGASAGVVSDIYLQVQINAGATYYLNTSGGWTPGILPLVKGFTLADVVRPGFYAAPMQNLPSGTYTFTLIATRSGILPVQASGQNVLLLASDVIASGSTTIALNPRPVASPVAFDPPAVLANATVGTPYSFNFAPFASGGSPPYHFQLDTLGGFPPFGLVLAPSGVLSGNPTQVEAVIFAVCAVDLIGDQDCVDVRVTVNPKATTPVTPPPGTSTGSTTGTWKGTWTRPTSGLCDYVTGELTWTLTQSGSTVTGAHSLRVTAIDPEGFCPYAVGQVVTDALVGGVVSGSSISISTSGGQTFSGTISGTTISGTGGTGSTTRGPFSLNKQ